jgi:hypothetical protein
MVGWSIASQQARAAIYIDPITGKPVVAGTGSKECDHWDNETNTSAYIITDSYPGSYGNVPGTIQVEVCQKCGHTRRTFIPWGDTA